jgi:NADH-quinone oxidoreductase subunit J
MIIQTLAFYLFAAICVASGVMVVTSRNPVHSVLYLILAFFNAAGLFVLMGAEFLAMILVVVYVGAVAVLFLFVVMMLDINFAELRSGFQRYLPIGLIITAILFIELALFIFPVWIVAPDIGVHLSAPSVGDVTNTRALGRVVYTQYLLLFEASGLVLLVAMIGAIVLTLRSREGVRKQKISTQIARRAEKTVELVKVPTGEGV